MLKRLIEVALPLKEVSEQSAREKSIRHGHISTLHIWWARRPLAACRAVVFASLIPDPDDPECPKDFRSLVMDTLKHERFRPNGEANGKKVEDTPRNRCLEFIKHLVKWENSNNPEFIEPARKLIAAAHKFLHSGAGGDAPKVLDPFAGGGAIPLEALRLGCDAHAVDLNPVAHLIELCTLVYPQKYGQPDSRPVPDYIKRLIAHNRAKKKVKGGSTLFEKDGAEAVAVEDDEMAPAVEITEAEYRKNPLAADVKYWGHWVLDKARKEIGQFYPADSDGGSPVAYLWARTVKCPNPECGATIPLYRQLWLAKKGKERVALKPVLDSAKRTCKFKVLMDDDIDFDPSLGTMLQGRVRCPLCSTTAASKYLQQECRAARMGQELMGVISVHPRKSGRTYRAPNASDWRAFDDAIQAMNSFKSAHGDDVLPQEEITKQQPRVMFVTLYGLSQWGDIFNSRQGLALCTFVRHICQAIRLMATFHEDGYSVAVGSVIGTNLGRAPDHWSTLCAWNPSGPKIQDVFSRQALPMVWDYAEANPFGGSVGDWSSSINWNAQNAVEAAANTSQLAATCKRGSATTLPYSDSDCDAVITDPPYYDAVPYAALSDFFYVWLKRTLNGLHGDLFRTPLTPKGQELIEERPHRSLKTRKDRAFYESGMAQAFTEARRVTTKNGICAVMFAHKTTTAWESLIRGLLGAGLVVTSSWPLHTEMRTRMRAMASAALASSVTIVCRKREENAGSGLWDDVRKGLQQVARERLDFFWSQGIRGADFFISAIGPALSVFGKYEKVTKLSGEEVSVGQFLDEVRGLVTSYALAKILKTTHTATIDPESRFYVVWKWSYGDTKVPADESFKLAQALGMDTDIMWDRTGVLEKAGENVQAVPVAKRMKIKDLGEPNADSTPASLIDVLHRVCVFRDKSDTDGMAEFLARSGQGKNSALWLVAQAVSEILPDGDKEKQLMQGLLNQREKLEPESGVLF
jgi:adenine-specific DNA methylase